MNIRPGSLVLEVGSGNSPRHESSILTDRYVYDNHQRAGKFSIVINRPFVVADGYRLPFKNKAFDYVICSHVLEHLEYPEKFMKELERVAKAGYIEVPNIFGERLFGWDFHLWYCQLKDNTLLFSAKKEGEKYGGFFHKLIAHSLGFRYFFEKHESKFYIHYEWKKKISFRKVALSAVDVRKVDKELFSLLSTFGYGFFDIVSFWLQWMARRTVNKTKKITRTFVWNIKKKLFKERVILDLMTIMQCVVCQSYGFVYEKYSITCKSCSSRYKLVGVVPIMLTKKEQKKGY